MKGLSKIVLAILVLCCVSCNSKSSYKDMNEELLNYNEIELSTFSISGTAVCDTCKKSDVTALQVEVIPVENPLSTLSMKTFGGLGTFSFSELRYKKGAKLTVYGRIYFDAGQSGMSSATEITVPSSDGDVVSCVLNFPHDSD